LKPTGGTDVKFIKNLLPVILVSLLISGSMNAASNGTDWELITQFKVPDLSFSQPLNNAVGFYDPSFGIMVGNGGVAHYTRDGGKT
jgi:hypothetical protein